jgi:glucose-1-phosphate cytidylyltransferase
MKTIILYGQLGTILHNETEFRFKPVVPVGGKTILWHIMQIFARFERMDYINFLCLMRAGDLMEPIYFIESYQQNYIS